MTTQKNPLRILATKIHSACKANGLKQTVILKSLTENQGFHSIQCTDKKASNNTAEKVTNGAIPAHVMTYINGLICDVLYESSSYDFFTEGLLDATIERTGDSLTTAIFSLLKENPVKFIMKINEYSEAANDLCESFLDLVISNSESLVREHFTSKELPIIITNAFVNEIMDGSDCTDSKTEWLNKAHILAFNQYNDLQKVANKLNESEIAQNLVDRNKSMVDNVLTESNAQSQLDIAINNAYVLSTESGELFLSNGKWSAYSLSSLDLDILILNEEDSLALSKVKSIIPDLDRARGINSLIPKPLKEALPELSKTLTMRDSELEQWALATQEGAEIVEYPFFTGFDRESYQAESGAGNTQLGYWTWVEHQIASFIEDTIEW